MCANKLCGLDLDFAISRKRRFTYNCHVWIARTRFTSIERRAYYIRIEKLYLKRARGATQPNRHRRRQPSPHQCQARRLAQPHCFSVYCDRRMEIIPTIIAIHAISVRLSIVSNTHRNLHIKIRSQSCRSNVMATDRVKWNGKIR